MNYEIPPAVFSSKKLLSRGWRAGTPIDTRQCGYKHPHSNGAAHSIAGGGDQHHIPVHENCSRQLADYLGGDANCRRPPSGRRMVPGSPFASNPLFTARFCQPHVSHGPQAPGPPAPVHALPTTGSRITAFSFAGGNGRAGLVQRRASPFWSFSSSRSRCSHFKQGFSRTSLSPNTNFRWTVWS